MGSDLLLKKTQEAMEEWFRRAIVAEEKMLGVRKALEQRDKENAELHERLNRENESANKHFTDSKKKDVEIAELQAALGKANSDLAFEAEIRKFHVESIFGKNELLTKWGKQIDELKTRLNDENERANAARKEAKELKDKLSISDFWKNAASNLREELSKAEATVATLQKRYDNAIEIGLGYMNQCEKAQSEVESLKGGISSYRITNNNLYAEVRGLKSTIERMSEKITTLTDDLKLVEARLEYSNNLVDKMGKEKQYLLDQLTDDEKKIAAMQETVGRYAAEYSRLNHELANARNELHKFKCNQQAAVQWPYTVTITTSGNVGIGGTK